MNSRGKYAAWHHQLATYEFAPRDLRHPWHLTVARLLPDLRGQKVLEIGCGRGDFAVWLAGKYPQTEVNAVDFSVEAIRIAKSRAVSSGARVNFAVDDAESLTFRDCSFDYVISCECLEHVADPLRMTSEMYRVLQPGGKVHLDH